MSIDFLTDETIEYKGYQHIVVLIWRIFLVAIILLPIAFSNALLYVLLSGIVILLLVFAYKNKEFIITNKRIISKYGLFAPKLNEILIPKVESITAETDLIDKIFGIGTIKIRGTGGYEVIFKRVSNYRETLRKVQEVIERETKK